MNNITIQYFNYTTKYITCTNNTDTNNINFDIALTKTTNY